MNTPAHVAASLLLWRREHRWRDAFAVSFGAVLPDLPMFGFYAYEKWIGSAEREIWTTLYFQDEWQLLFDAFNSIPLAVVVIVICRRGGCRWGFLLAASSLLHFCCDFPLHHDDAHRHFLPLTNWRFRSPFSYWDPRHHGYLFMTLEFLFSLTASAFVTWRGARPTRAIASILLLFYAVIFCIAAGLLTAYPDSHEAAGRKPSGFVAPDGLRRSAKSVTKLWTSPKSQQRSSRGATSCDRLGT